MTAAAQQHAPPAAPRRRPASPVPGVRVSIVDEAPVVIAGLTAMLRPYARRIHLMTPSEAADGERSDVALCDPFVSRGRAPGLPDDLLADPTGPAFIAYSWLEEPDAVERALARGCAGYVSKSATAAQVVDAVERVASGERGVREPEPAAVPAGTAAMTGWPGREHGLSRRESQILSLICQGATNQDISERAYLSPNTVKSYIRTAYRKAGVTRRSEAVRWGIERGMLEPQERPVA